MEKKESKRRKRRTKPKKKEEKPKPSKKPTAALFAGSDSEDDLFGSAKPKKAAPKHLLL